MYDEDKTLVSHTDSHPDKVTGDYHAALTIGLLVPNCEYRYCRAADDSGECMVWFLDPRSQSWASIDYTPGTNTSEVNQLGPRHLWDEVEAAYTWWGQADSPTADQWCFTGTPQGQHVDLAGTQSMIQRPMLVEPHPADLIRQ